MPCPYNTISNIKQFIPKLQSKENLTQDEIKEIMQAIMSGEAHEDDVAAFLLALRAKGPTVDEITGAAQIMRKFVVGIDTLLIQLDQEFALHPVFQIFHTFIARRFYRCPPRRAIAYPLGSRS